MSARATQSTEQLVDRVRDPAAPLPAQHAAFARLVERSQHLVLAYALATLRDFAEAEDAAQETFTTAWLRLHQLRDASAFTAWLKTIVVSQCTRRLLRRSGAPEPVELRAEAGAERGRSAYQSVVASALATLPAGERHVTVLFYFLGYTLEEIARLLHLKPGTVGKRLHSARLRIRGQLPPSVREELVRVVPSRTFLEQVRLGAFDEYVGEYRFERRPDHVVRIVREGASLVSVAAGQRHVLASLSDETLLTRHYDGVGRFGRDRHGRITHFVYYEFGRRLGIARKAPGEPTSPASRR